MEVEPMRFRDKVNEATQKAPEAENYLNNESGTRDRKDSPEKARLSAKSEPKAQLSVSVTELSSTQDIKR